MKTEHEKECRIFKCDKHNYHKCCYYCEDKHKCDDHCLNAPSLCGQYITRDFIFGRGY